MSSVDTKARRPFCEAEKVWLWSRMLVRRLALKFSVPWINDLSEVYREERRRTLEPSWPKDRVLNPTVDQVLVDLP